jgi:cytochrome c-type biogenesis protein CcmH/NrfG
VSPSTRYDPDALASLESERDFLLRSIADLETERESGNLDEERYRALKDDYTARAAAVLRSIEEGQEAVPAAAPVPRNRKLFTGGAVLAFVVVAALALAAASGTRRDGQTVTGNAQSGGAQSGDARRAALERQVREHPDDATAHLVYGRYLLEVQDWPEAVKQYLSAAKLDPKNPEANAYAGWMLFQVAQSPNADPKTAGELVDGALTRLDAAVAAAADYPDAYFFRGMVQFRGRNNPKAAIPDFERYLALVPTGPLHEQVKQVLEQARQSAD